MFINPADRRRFPRFRLEAGYTELSVRFLDRETFDHHGHAYNISEGGVQFELDRGIEPGTSVAMQITLPTMAQEKCPGRAIFVFANVIWLEDEDEPGPVRMAAVFSRFAREGDRERLLAAISRGQYRIAA
jgi:hypothetical protein